MQNKTYIIGEIGQNHNGSVDIAKSIIDLCSKGIKEDIFGYKLNGLDAVKLTKKRLKTRIVSIVHMAKVYNSPNSLERHMVNIESF